MEKNESDFFSLLSYTEGGANRIKKIYEQMGFKFIKRYGNPKEFIIQDFENKK
jgi:hypothetical protein